MIISRRNFLNGAFIGSATVAVEVALASPFRWAGQWVPGHGGPSIQSIAGGPRYLVIDPEVVRFVQSYGGSFFPIFFPIAASTSKVHKSAEIGKIEQLEQICPVLIVEVRDIQVFIEAIFAAPFDLIRANGTLLSVENHGVVHWIENLAPPDFYERVARLQASGQIPRALTGSRLSSASRSFVAPLC